MKRRFNISGPCIASMHYMIPAERRLPQAPGLVDQLGYFVVHAPRQTGKTTALIALAHDLTASGRYAAVLSSCEAGQAAGDDFDRAEKIVLSTIQLKASSLPVELRPPPSPAADTGSRIHAALRAWARACPRPIVLLLDEIDALHGPSIITILRQLRAGFPDRPAEFPASVILCGLRDVRDYKAASGGDPSRLGTASPFNIKLKSLRLGDFTPDEVRELYAQHTADTGQAFTEEALSASLLVTGGQPWLVNALAREIVEEMAVPPEQEITPAHVEEAKERLILERATHLDSLVDKLREPRVKRVMEPLLAGKMMKADAYDDDLRYCRDLGLLAPNNPIRIANSIYREVIVRVLGGMIEAQVFAEPQSFVLPDGRLDLRRVLGEFAEFWKEHGDVLASGMSSYHEVAPQLVLMAFLQRVVNGGGFIDREYGIGRGRIDLLVRWPYRGADGERASQREALELKVWRDKNKDPLAKGLAQLDSYLDKTGLDTGVLVIFDRRAKAKSIEARTRFTKAVSPAGRKVRVLRA